MKKYIISLCLASMILLSSCANHIVRVPTASFVDPDFNPKKFKNICVMVDTENLIYKQDTEDYLSEWLTSYRCKNICSYEIIFPGRDYSDEQIHAILIKNNIDGYLLLSIGTRDVYERYVPASTVTTSSTETKKGKSKGKDKKKGKDVVVHRSSTSVTDAHIVSSSVTAYHTQLIDTKTSQTVWKAYSRKRGRHSTYQLAGSIIDNLAEDGLIKRKPDKK